MSERTTDEASEAMANTIAASLGELVTGWVLVAESITDQGEQAIWYLRPEEQPDWRTLGFLEYAKIRTSRGDDE